MLLKLLKFILIFFSIIIIGCTTTSKLTRNQVTESDNIDLVIKQIVEDINLKTNSTKKPLKIFTTDIRNVRDKVSNLEGYIKNQFILKFSSARKFELLNQSILEEFLSRGRITFSELNDQEIRNELINYSGADVIFTGNTENISYNNSIRIEIGIFDLKSGKFIFEINKVIEKDNKIRRLMGEKIPGKLIVKTYPSGSQVYVDSELKGETNKNGLQMIIPPGTHNLKIQNTGFSNFYKTIYIDEDGYNELKVKFAEDNLAPIKCVLASAIIPGMGGWIYGSPTTAEGVERPIQDMWLTSSATVFYVSAGLYAWDEFSKEPDFFSSKHKDQFNGVKNIELYIAIGAYVVNLVSSYIVGNEYKNRNRTAKEVSFINNKSIKDYSKIYLQNKTLLQISYNF